LFVNRNYCLLLGLLVLALASCSRQSQQPTPTSDYRFDLAVEPEPAAVGQTVLLVTLTGPDGATIDEAQVSARGDMTHAGMTPSFGEGIPEGKGRYRIPFVWTMGGDWLLTLHAVLPDGQEIEQTFDLAVSSGS
jgi:hypothetical protein